jgi:hypothetical protein
MFEAKGVTGYEDWDLLKDTIKTVAGALRVYLFQSFNTSIDLFKLPQRNTSDIMIKSN